MMSTTKSEKSEMTSRQKRGARRRVDQKKASTAGGSEPASTATTERSKGGRRASSSVPAPVPAPAPAPVPVPAEPVPAPETAVDTVGIGGQGGGASKPPTGAVGTTGKSPAGTPKKKGGPAPKPVPASPATTTTAPAPTQMPWKKALIPSAIILVLGVMAIGALVAIFSTRGGDGSFEEMTLAADQPSAIESAPATSAVEPNQSSAPTGPSLEIQPGGGMTLPVRTRAATIVDTLVHRISNLEFQNAELRAEIAGLQAEVDDISTTTSGQTATPITTTMTVPEGGTLWDLWILVTESYPTWDQLTSYAGANGLPYFVDGQGNLIVIVHAGDQLPAP